MNTLMSARAISQPAEDLEKDHRRTPRHRCISAAFTLTMAVYGASYYLLAPPTVPLRNTFFCVPAARSGSSSSLGTVLFFGIYFYYFRKRWGWLRGVGAGTLARFPHRDGRDRAGHYCLPRCLQISRHRGNGFLDHGGGGGQRPRRQVSLFPIPRRLNAAEKSPGRILKDEQEDLTKQLATQKIFALHRDLSSAFRPLPHSE